MKAMSMFQERSMLRVTTQAKPGVRLMFWVIWLACTEQASSTFLAIQEGGHYYLAATIKAMAPFPMHWILILGQTHRYLQMQ